VTAGTTSRNNAKRFAVSAVATLSTPVALPPGRPKLATKPDFTGSVPPVKTIGIDVVAALAASAGALPPVATITAT